MEEKTQYAIIQTGGKQYRVAEGDVVEVERLGIDNGEKVEFKEVLFYSNAGQATVGKPTVEKCIVSGELLDEVKGPKIISFKFKRRKNYHRKIGHRQNYSRVKITGITHGS